MPVGRQPALENFTTFGDLLRYLRRRAGLTQTDLSIAVGYSHGQISRLEHNRRTPDLATIAARFIPALQLEDEPALRARLLEMAAPGLLTLAAGAVPLPPHNLPHQLTSFIGRDQEMAQVERLVTLGRLVTMTGPGGVGKTRLALQVAARLVDDFPDGAWLVELAPLSNPDLVLHALESALRLRGESGFDALVAFLVSRRLLLVIDNCEHLIARCAELTEALLHACSGLTVLATSRENLGVAGETVFPVPSLGMPSLEQEETQPVSQYEAVRLFVERAAAVRHSFQLDAHNAPAIVQVCAQLDGLPLAIELAAAQVSVLTVQQLAQRIAMGNQFRLLTSSQRGSVPRHQTLAAMIDWSYELLDETERRLLQRLSVFSGGWTLEAVEAICAEAQSPGAAGQLHQSQIVPLLGRLAGKSLIQAQPGTGEEMRYFLLETIRQYARERLLETGESVFIEERHFEFFLRWAERAEPEVSGPRKLQWLDQLQADHGNLRAALEWGLARAEKGEASLRLAGALLGFWHQRSHVTEGRAWLERALASPHAPTTGAVRARALGAAGWLAHLHGDEGTAQTLLEDGVGLGRDSGEAGTVGLARDLVTLGEVNRALGDPASARALLEEAITLCQSLGDRWGLAYALSLLGRALRDQEEFEMGRSMIIPSIALWREVGDLWGLHQAIHSLGEVALRRGYYQDALAVFYDCLVIAREINDEETMAWCFSNLCVVTLCLDDRAKAKLLNAEAERLQRASGNQYGILACLFHSGIIAQLEGQSQQANAYFHQVLALARRVGPTFVRASPLLGLSGVAAAEHGRRAAVLLGAAEAQLEAGASYWNSYESQYAEGARTAAKAQLGEEQFAAAYAEGRAMTFDQAAAYALQAPHDGLD